MFRFRTQYWSNSFESGFGMLSKYWTIYIRFAFLLLWLCGLYLYIFIELQHLSDFAATDFASPSILWIFNRRNRSCINYCLEHMLFQSFELPRAIATNYLEETAKERLHGPSCCQLWRRVFMKVRHIWCTEIISTCMIEIVCNCVCAMWVRHSYVRIWIRQTFSKHPTEPYCKLHFTVATLTRHHRKEEHDSNYPGSWFFASLAPAWFKQRSRRAVTACDDPNA